MNKSNNGLSRHRRRRFTEKNGRYGFTSASYEALTLETPSKSNAGGKLFTPFWPIRISRSVFYVSKWRLRDVNTTWWVFCCCCCCFYDVPYTLLKIKVPIRAKKEVFSLLPLENPFTLHKQPCFLSSSSENHSFTGALNIPRMVWFFAELPPESVWS